MDYLLYYSPGACSLAPHIALEWARASYDAWSVRPQSPELIAISPIGAVPVLQRSDGWVLNQAGAILHYLARRFPEARMGSDGSLDGDAEFDRWSSYFTGDLHPVFYPLFSAERYTTDTDPCALDNVRAAAFNLVRKKLSVLDTQLSHNTYVLGERRTVLDAYALPMLRWADSQLPEHLSEFHCVAALKARLEDDPDVRRVLDIEAGG
ncbi:glutathione S-transferase [Burkholderia cepacia]|uniref:Glutathione S-transferase N-terminal domain-containing protein n=1 Tax=Burkholderia cenocepacia TaxID=95486 RepID=A0ABD4UJU7_9BURK|nr:MULTISPECIES: glutathione S-transferase C-terminal domain-containing protein [Burkholderia cepacia complex]KVV23137.1 glutathione S-transferase [Burkholderia cepacia]MCW3698185.1 glutathione S-transferase N-terminal domain-containing protein [Burkholderia cenocepacia]MCW3706038.1 glutathione S-transferase N-terminal domain-containing protein [Burkholderia cenocepacia]MCW3714279.1 glutathione S-transferase N-terminal domain-containing protein [Burkholderia cenocepacia]MCW3722345.1 glutathion